MSKQERRCVSCGYAFDPDGRPEPDRCRWCASYYCADCADKHGDACPCVDWPTLEAERMKPGARVSL